LLFAASQVLTHRRH